MLIDLPPIDYKLYLDNLLILHWLFFELMYAKFMSQLGTLIYY